MIPLKLFLKTFLLKSIFPSLTERGVVGEDMLEDLYFLSSFLLINSGETYGLRTPLYSSSIEDLNTLFFRWVVSISIYSIKN